MYLRSDFELIIYAPSSCLAHAQCATIRMNTVFIHQIGHVSVAYFQMLTGQDAAQMWTLRICGTLQHFETTPFSQTIQYKNISFTNKSKISCG